MTDTRKSQLNIGVNTTDVKAGFQEIKQAGKDMASSLAQSGTQASKAVDGISAGSSKSAQEVDKATRSMISSIQRTTAAMEAGSKSGSKYFEALAAQRGVDVNQLKPYLAQLDAVSAKQKDTGISAAQMQAALRGVPAQFTDIASSLASGQRPLQVFLQQGGQLKDMFGGMGPAARALGGYVVGLVNPFTLAAAATIGLATAYYQGRKESEAYNKALILSGNVAGETSSHLQSLAQNVSKAFGTQGAAAEVIAEMAGNSKIASENLEQFARVALQMDKAVGKSTSDTVKELAQLGEAPLEAAYKLNQQYGFLTAGVYEQIKALQTQGRTEEASAVAQKAYADAFDFRSKQILDNLGFIDRALNSGKDAWKSFWDAALDIGRPDTAETVLRKLDDQIANLEGRISRMRQPGGGWLQQFLASRDESNLSDLRSQRQVVGDGLNRSAIRAADVGIEQKLNAMRIEWARQAEQSLERRVQLERELKTARTEGLALGLSEEEIGKRILSIRKKYSDIYNDGINAQIEAIKRRGQIEDEVLRRQLAQLQVNRQIGATNEEDTIKAVADAELAAFDRRKKALKEELDLTKGKQNSLKDQQNIIGQIDLLNSQRLTREKQLSNDLLLLDVNRNRAAMNQYADLVDKADGEVRAIRDRVLAQEDYNEAIGLTGYALGELEAARLRRLADMKDERADLAELTDMTGELTDRYREQAKMLRDLASKKELGAQKDAMVDVWRSVDAAAHDAFIHIGESGKSVFKRLADSLKSGVYDLLYQLTARRWLLSIGATVTGVPGMAAAANASPVLSSLGMVGAGKSLWDGFSTAASTVGGWLGLSSMGAAGATGVTAAAGSGLSLASAGGGLGFAATGGTGLTLGTAGTTAATGTAGAITEAGAAAGAAGGGAMSSILTAAPYIAAAAAVAAIVAKGLSMKTVGSGVLGTISGDTFSGSAYDFKKGGFLRGGSKTVTSDLDKAVNDTFSAAIKGMYANFSALGKTVGAGGDLLKGFSYEFRLALRDFDDAGKQKEIQRALSSMSDSMAKAFVDSFRTSIDTAKKAANEYWTNTIDGERSFGTGEVVTKARTSSPLDPYIDDIIRIFDAQKDSLSGVSGAEGKLSAFTSALFGLGDGLVENAGYLSTFGEALDFKKLEAAAKSAETVVDAFGRLNSVFLATNGVARQLGKDAEAAFGQVGLASADARQRLVDLSGGLSSLASKSAAFAESFLTEAERIAPVQKQVAEEMARLGYAGIATRDEFKNLVRGLDLGSEAGAKLYSQLMNVAPAFAQVADYAAKAADEAIAAAKAFAQAKLESSSSAVDAAFSALQRSVDAQKSAISGAYATATTAIKSRIDSISGSVGKLDALARSLGVTLDRISAPTDAATLRASAQTQIESALAAARAGGNLPDADSLSKALDVIARPSEDLFSTFTDYKRDSLRAYSNISELQKLTEKEKSVQEKILDATKDQLDAEEKRHQDEMKALDDQLSAAQAQINAIKGVDTSIKSVAQAIASLGTALGGLKVAQQVAAPQINSQGATAELSAVERLYLTYAGRTRDQIDDEGGAYWAAQFNSGKSLAEIEKAFQASVKAVRGYAVGGDHMGGWRLVGERGPELEATGPSRIFNAAQTAEILRGGDNGEAAEEIRVLREEVSALLQNISAETRASAQYNSKVAKTLDRLSPDGVALSVKVEA